MDKFKWQVVNEPGKEVNEDIAYADENMAWVLDAATGLTDKKLTSGGTDGEWFVKQWDIYLRDNLPNTEEPIEDIVIRGIPLIKDKFYEESNVNFIESIARPSASMVLVRRKNDKIEYFSLGDCTLLIKDLKGKVTLIKDKTLEKFDGKAVTKMNKLRVKNNLTAMEAREVINPTLIKHRLLKNKEDGYWTLEFDNNAVNYSIKGDVNIKDIDSLVLMSDGYAAIFDTYNYCTEVQLIDMLEIKGAKEVYKVIRDIEEDDCDITKYPRFKKGDDSSVVFLK